MLDRFRSSLHPAASVTLACALLCSVFAGFAAASEGGNSIEVKQEGFWDRNGVWNITPAFVFRKMLSYKWALSWEQEFDVVSGASRRLGSDMNSHPFGDQTDAVSGASKVEFRHSENPVVTYTDKGTVASGSFYFSRENDYTSLAPAFSVAQDFNGRNTTVGASYAEFFDNFHPYGAYAGQGGKKRIRSLGASVAQSLTPLTLVGVSGTFINSWGYLGHPYNPPMDSAGTMMTEKVPDSKRGVAAAFQVVQGYHWRDKLGSVNLDVRRYGDDWGLRSNTADVKVSQYLAEGLYVRVRGRYYTQTGTSFARPYYNGDEAYRTADIRFYPFSSWLIGLKFSGPFSEKSEDSFWMPDRWDVSYDHLLRDTKGDPDAVAGQPRVYRYQLYGPDENYLQGVIMLGLLFNL